MYRLHAQYGLVSDDFETVATGHPDFVESSRYAFHVADWRRTFGEDAVLVVFFDDLQREPRAYLETVCDFAGVVPESFDTLLERAEDLKDPSTDFKARSHLLGRLGLGVGDWLRGHRFYGVIDGAKRLGMRRFFFGNGPTIPSLTPAVENRIRVSLDDEILGLQVLTGRDLSCWRANRP